MVNIETNNSGLQSEVCWHTYVWFRAQWQQLHFFLQPINSKVSDSQATRIYWFQFETQALNIGVIDNEIVT
jgi:hypothetical protein